MYDYKKYEVWHKAHEVCLHAYKEIISHFLNEERFELTSQIKSAANSISLNIAKGCARNSHSTHEVEYWALLAFDLAYIKQEHDVVFKKVNDVKAMLINLKLVRK